MKFWLLLLLVLFCGACQPKIVYVERPSTELSCSDARCELTCEHNHAALTRFCMRALSEELRKVSYNYSGNDSMLCWNNKITYNESTGEILRECVN